MMEAERRGRVAWVRRRTIGRGSFGTVSLATTTTTTDHNHQPQLPPLMAVKSAEFPLSTTLFREYQILRQLQGCPHVIRCYGYDLTCEDNHLVYNLLLEFASGGSLADLIASSHGGLPEFEVRRYTQSLLEGLSNIHRGGYVHCDIKPPNILFRSSSLLKIADFGLAKMVGESGKQADKTSSSRVRGTPLYVSPEAVKFKVYEPPSDIWALGCTLIKMLTGKPAWDTGKFRTKSDLLFMIGFSHESPNIPDKISQVGKNFLEKCFIKDPRLRWTADMLLNHPFVAKTTTMAIPSPMSAFDWTHQPTLTQRGSLCGEIRKLSKEPCSDDWIILNVNQEEEIPVSPKSVECQVHEDMICFSGKVIAWKSSEEEEERETWSYPIDVIHFLRPNLPPKVSSADGRDQLAEAMEPRRSFLEDWMAVREARTPVSLNQVINCAWKEVEEDEFSRVYKNKFYLEQLELFPGFLGDVKSQELELSPLDFLGDVQSQELELSPLGFLGDVQSQELELGFLGEVQSQHVVGRCHLPYHFS